MEAIRGEIEKDLGFLEPGLRDVSERHRSLRGVFDYSWNLLSEKEREILSRPTLFRGDFDRRAAGEIAGGDLASLTSPVDKSLVRVLDNERYERHEPVRTFGGERPARDLSVLDETRARFCEYYGHFLNGHWGITEEDQAAIALEIANIGRTWRGGISPGWIRW